MPLILVALLCSPAVLLAEEGPIVKQEFIYETAPFPSCHASTIEQAANGDLLCAWFAGTNEGEKDVGIWLSRFDGAAWSAPVEVARDPAEPCWNPVLFRTREGEVLLFYKAGPNPRQWSGLLIRSQDDGRTWSEPEWLPAGVLGPIKNRPLQLDNGDIVCGSSVESYRLWGCHVEITGDSGRTWRHSNPINVPGKPYGIIQPGMFVAGPGRLGMVCRSTQAIGEIVSAFSEDGGHTWTDAQPIGLPNPNSGIDAGTLADGRIVMVYNHTSSDRHPINLAVSEDGGRTFAPALVLEDGDREFSYPAVIQTTDGLIHITYTWARTHIRHTIIDPNRL